MASYIERRKWLIYGFGFFLIAVLLISLIFLIVSEKNLPDNAVIVDEATIEGGIKDQETIDRLRALQEKEPVLKELPLTVEYYSDDYSEYTKYTISYGLDDSERGFYLIMKDYTSEGMGAAIIKLGEMGMNTVGLELKYEDLADDTLNFRAE